MRACVCVCVCEAIPCGGIGVVVGGVIMYFNKSKGHRAALINWLLSVVVIGPMLVFLLYCPTVNLAGVSQHYPNNGYIYTCVCHLHMHLI